VPGKYHINSWLICLLLSSTCSYAETTTDQPIEIRADSMQLNIEDGDSEYRGNVLIRRGDITLQGDLVHISRSEGEVRQILVEGKPASYEQLSGSVSTDAKSNNMLFDVNSNILTMRDAARLHHDDQIIESNFIQFDTDKQVLLAGQQDKSNTTQDKQRVNIILSPSKKP